MGIYVAQNGRTHCSQIEQLSNKNKIFGHQGKREWMLPDTGGMLVLVVVEEQGRPIHQQQRIHRRLRQRRRLQPVREQPARQQHPRELDL